MPLMIFPYQQFIGTGGSSQQQLSTQIDNLSARILAIEQALTAYSIAIDETDADVQKMFDDVFSGNDTEPVTPQNEDEAEVFSMLDDVFDGTGTEGYEDEVTQDFDTIFNP